MSHSFEELWTLFLEGELSPEELILLQQMLEADPDLVRQAADLYEEHRLLGFLLQPFDDERFVRDARASVESEGQRFVGGVIDRLRSKSQPRSRPSGNVWWSRIPAYALVAATTLLITLTLQLLVQPGTGNPVPQDVVQAEVEHFQGVEYVATLARCEACDWDTPQLGEGRRLVADRLMLKSGTAVIQFDGGASALLKGPAELELESAAGANLLSGNVVIRAPEEAAGFVLRTPASDIVDLGTEFSVSVDDSGATELHVTEGEVEWHYPDHTAQQGVFLEEGHAVRFDPATGNAQPIPLERRRFSDGIPSHPQRSGRLLVSESFDYPFEVTNTEEKAADGGLGWETPWFCGFQESSFNLIFDPETNLRGPSGFPESRGGLLRLPTDDVSRRHRQASKRGFADVIDLRQDGVVYFSFLVQRDAFATQQDKGSFHWILCKPRDLKARLGVGILSDGRPIIYGPTGNIAGSSRLKDEVTYCFVGKLIHGRRRPEQLFLKVFEPDERLDTAEPLDWTLVGRTVHRNQKLSQVHVYNAPGRGYLVDEMRIGTTWQAVTSTGDHEFTSEARP